MPTVVELKAQAKRRGFKGYSKLKKTELIQLLSTKSPDKVIVPRRVTFGDDVIETFSDITDSIKLERQKLLKKINKDKKINRKLSKIYYKDVSNVDEYVKIKKYNMNSKNKLKKKEPLKFIKGIDYPTEKRSIYKQEKYKRYKIKYKITEKKKSLVLKIYNKKNIDKIIETTKVFKFDKSEFDKYRAEYLLKIFLIEKIRKIIKKA